MRLPEGVSGRIVTGLLYCPDCGLLVRGEADGGPGFILRQAQAHVKRHPDHAVAWTITTTETGTLGFRKREETS